MSSHAPPLASNETTSVLIRRTLAELSGETVSLGYLVLKLRRRSFGGLLILLAALGLLPGISSFAGLAMVVPGLQMAIGYRTPLLPRFLRRRRLKVAKVRALGARAVPWIERLERPVRPRWPRLTLPPVPAVIGVLVVGLGLVVISPLPLSNTPPAIAILCLSLGLLERDGVFVAAGLAISVLALAIGAAMYYGAFEAAAVLIRGYGWG